MPGSAVGQRDPHCGHSPGQSGAAQRRERQRQPDRVDDRLLEVDGRSSTDVADFVGLGGGLGGAVRVGEQLGEVDLDIVR